MFAAFFDKTRQLYKIFYSFIHTTKNTVFVVNYSNIYSTGFLFALLRVVFRFDIEYLKRSKNSKFGPYLLVMVRPLHRQIWWLLVERALHALQPPTQVEVHFVVSGEEGFSRGISLRLSGWRSHPYRHFVVRVYFSSDVGCLCNDRNFIMSKRLFSKINLKGYKYLNVKDSINIFVAL